MTGNFWDLRVSLAFSPKMPESGLAFEGHGDSDKPMTMLEAVHAILAENVDQRGQYRIVAGIYGPFAGDNLQPLIARHDYPG